MTALLERLNISRRFARSVYALHKLALRQGVPSALRAVGVTASAPQSASRNVAPRAFSVPVAPLEDAVASGAVAAQAINPAAFEPQVATNLEPMESVNLEPPLNNAAFSDAPLEVASDLSLDAPVDLAPSAPLPKPVMADSPLEQGVQTLTAQTLLAQPDPLQTQPSAALESLVSTPVPRISDAPPVGERLDAVRRAESNDIASETAGEPAFATPAPAVAAPIQPLLEPPLTAPDLEGSPDPAPASAPAAGAPAANNPVPLAPELIAPSIAAPVNLEVAAPNLAAPPAADAPASSPNPVGPPARGRVIEEFQARPPRNMPPRDSKTAQPATAPQAPLNQTPRRPPEEWARLLRQRFAQPGDDAIGDASTPDIRAALEVATPQAAQLEVAQPQAAQLEVAQLETALSDSGAPTASSEPRANIVAPPGGQIAVSLEDSLDAASDSEIRERSQAALQAIPEDMTKRSPRDWGLALIRRYASLDEAAAIGIDAYRDPNDLTPSPAPAPPASSPTRTTPAMPVPTSLSSAAPLEPALSPARRFVAPRTSATVAPVTVAPVTVAPAIVAPAIVASAQAGAGLARPAAQQPAFERSSAPIPAPLEQSSNPLEVAPPIPAPLEPSRPAIATDLVVDAPLETADFAGPHADVGLELGSVSDAQLARAAVSPDASPSGNSSPNIVPANTGSPVTPTLEPVRLSGATRRFLEPLVGFDPSEVGVYTGDAASRVTDQLRADAAAQGGAVLLPDASNLETPAQLGLLAHELIHAGQQQSAGAPPPDVTLEIPASVQSPLESPRSFEATPRRFVPALGSADTRSADTRRADTRSTDTRTATPSSSAALPSNAARFSNAVRQSSAPLLEGIADFASEEDRALVAEARVRRIAGAEPSSADSTLPVAHWNGLPAPWERLPSFGAPSSDTAPPSDTAPSDTAPTEPGVVSLIGAGLSSQGWGGSATTTTYGSGVSPSNSGFSSSASSNGSAPQAAETGRELPAATTPNAAAPDLEQLAKQVYDVLKRRLQSDRRRSGV